MIGLIRVICSVFSGTLADKMGRRFLFISGGFSIALTLLLMGIMGQFHMYGGVKVALLLYVISNGATFVTILPVYMAEILPLNGCGLAVSFENLTVCAIIFAYPFLVEKLTLYPVFYICFGFACLGLVHSYLRVKETKGKKDYEIYNEFTVEGANIGLLDDDMFESFRSDGISLAGEEKRDLNDTVI